MVNKLQNKAIFSILSVLVLSSCSMTGFKHSIGLGRDAPDEFMVMPRQNLKVPTQPISLPAPTDKKQAAAAASIDAKQDVFGNAQAAPHENSPLENNVLSKIGKTDDSIRDKVDNEHAAKTGVFGTKRGGTLDSILNPFGYNDPKEPVVDPKKENDRVKAAITNGQKIDPTAVATKDPRKEKWKSDKGEDKAGPTNAPVDEGRDLTAEPDL